jgi:hypothetical protein
MGVLMKSRKAEIEVSTWANRKMLQYDPKRLDKSSSSEAQDDSVNSGMIQWYTRKKAFRNSSRSCEP